MSQASESPEVTQDSPSSSRPFHAFCLAAPHSGGGKTTIALMLMRAFRNRGMRVQGFKCGPDYIDPSFHRQATGNPSFNLDTWMMGHEGVRAVWQKHAAQADIAICEGVMGLFDSRQPGDMAGSTADCALALDIPVILVVPAKGMAGSIAPLVAGFRDFHPRVHIAGVIANGVGSIKHACLLAEALKLEGLPPLVGALTNQEQWKLPERQLGLVPAEEYDQLESWFDALDGEWNTKWFEFDTILELTRTNSPEQLAKGGATPPLGSKGRIGIARDEAFCFYYDENLDHLTRQGWELVPFSPLNDTSLPDNLDMLYLGGGYPEIFAKELSSNGSMRESIRTFAATGKSIFAECGGYMYLGTTLITARGDAYPMCGLINGTCNMGTKLRSLGYREVELVPGSLPWLPGATSLRGHEFHWSDMELHESYPPLYSYRDLRGNECRDGVVHNNICAGYIHLYWAHTPETTLPQSSVPRHAGRVLLLNGASSSGKTSLAHAFRQHCHFPVMIFSIDSFLPICGSAGQSVAEAVDDTRLPLIEAFHAGIAASARAGAFVVVDHVIGESAAWVRDLNMRLGSLPLQTIRVHCAQDMLVARENSRTDRQPDIPHALRQASTIHQCMDYKLDIDTTHQSADACALELLKALERIPGFLPSSAADTPGQDSPGTSPRP